MSREFDGASEHHLAVVDITPLDLTTVTLAAWVYPDTLNTGDIRVIWYNGGFRWLQTTAQNVVVTGQWTHIAAAYDGGSSKKLWVNGVSESVTDASGGAAMLANSENFEIGRRKAGGPTTEMFDGKI